MADDKLQGYAVMNGVSHFSTQFVVFTAKSCIQISDQNEVGDV